MAGSSSERGCLETRFKQVQNEQRRKWIRSFTEGHNKRVKTETEMCPDESVLWANFERVLELILDTKGSVIYPAQSSREGFLTNTFVIFTPSSHIV